MAPQRAVDVGLIASSSAGVALEPSDDGRIQTDGDCCLTGQYSAPRRAAN